MGIYNIHAGHSAVGQGAIGAVSILNESIEDRVIKDKVIKLLKDNGHTVYDCTVDSGTKNSILSDIVKKCNAHKVDLDVSIHFNAGVNRKTKDGITTGTEVYCYNSSTTVAVQAAKRIVDNISSIGFKNRGVKYNKNLYVLANTVAPALLIEVCFVDDADDAQLYYANVDRIAKAIAEGITGTAIIEKKEIQIEPIMVVNPFQIKVLADSLNIRKEPSTTSVIVGNIAKGGVYTITQMSGNWGALKSGAGWVYISDKYVQVINNQSNSNNNTNNGAVSNAQQTSVQNNTSGSFLVKIATDSLNVRQEASANSKIVGTVKEGQVYTITQITNSNWGKLKSGLGWINLNYTKRV